MTTNMLAALRRRPLAYVACRTNYVHPRGFRHKKQPSMAGGTLVNPEDRGLEGRPVGTTSPRLHPYVRTERLIRESGPAEHIGWIGAEGGSAVVALEAEATHILRNGAGAYGEE